MDRINAYTTRAPDGSTSVDIEGMMVDLITIVKVGGVPKADFLDFAAEVFDEVTVNVSIPQRQKN
jgi:hypothetical protein